MPKPFVLSVKAVIRDEQGRILVIRRSASSKNNAGMWDFPGGKSDQGESFDAALVREVREETGVGVELSSVLGAAESDLPDRKVAYMFVLAQVSAGQVRLSEEHSDFAWMPPRELAEAEMCPQFRSFVRQLVADKR